MYAGTDAFGFSDYVNDWHGISVFSYNKKWRWFSPSILISPSRNLLQIRVTSNVDDRKNMIYAYSLTRVSTDESSSYTETWDGTKLEDKLKS